MKQCKKIGCGIQFQMSDENDYCPKCRNVSASNDSFVQEFENDPDSPTADEFLRKGLQHMEDRARTHDAPEGERSMGSTVSMFNILTGHSLTETEGWKFMQVLKMVRSVQGDFNPDNYEDGASYAGLAGEAHARETALEQA